MIRASGSIRRVPRARPSARSICTPASCRPPSCMPGRCLASGTMTSCFRRRSSTGSCAAGSTCSPEASGSQRSLPSRNPIASTGLTARGRSTTDGHDTALGNNGGRSWQTRCCPPRPQQAVRRVTGVSGISNNIVVRLRADPGEIKKSKSGLKRRSAGDRAQLCWSPVHSARGVLAKHRQRTGCGGHHRRIGNHSVRQPTGRASVGVHRRRASRAEYRTAHAGAVSVAAHRSSPELHR